MTARSPTMVTLHDTRFVECRWWNDGWTVKTVVTCWSSTSMIPDPGFFFFFFSFVRWKLSLLDEGGSASQVPQATVELAGHGSVV